MSKRVRLISAGLLACSMGAQASITITIQEEGGDVVVRGSGSVITENMDCNFPDNTVNTDSISSRDASGYFLMQTHPIFFAFGSPSNDSVCNLPTAERTGLGISTEPTSGVGDLTGDLFAVGDYHDYDQESGITISLPYNYSSGENLEFSGLLKETSLAELNLIPGGSYTWTWSTQPAEALTKAINTEFLLIKVQGDLAPASATPVPTLGIFGLIGLAGAIGAAGVAMTRRRKK